MADNFTFQQRLIEEMPGSGFLSSGKPVGREGFEVIVMERIGTGSRYYCTLAPGDMLRISERMFGNYYAYVVDMRPARVLEISEQFPTANPLIKVRVAAKVLYRVINSRCAAVEVDDPLAKFRDRILGMLRREIGQLSYQKINESACERIIMSIGVVQHLGIAVEGVDYLIIDHDSQVIKGMQQRAELEYNRNLGQEMDEDAFQRAKRKQTQEQELKRRDIEEQLALERKQKESEVEQQQLAVQGLNLRDLNTLLHLRPELTETIFTRLNEREQAELALRMTSDQQIQQRMLDVLDNYIHQNKDADPEDIMRLIRGTFPQSSDRPRITFGGNNQSEPKRIAFGKVLDNSSPPPSPPAPSGDDDDD